MFWICYIAATRRSSHSWWHNAYIITYNSILDVGLSVYCIAEWPNIGFICAICFLKASCLYTVSVTFNFAGWLRRVLDEYTQHKMTDNMYFTCIKRTQMMSIYTDIRSLDNGIPWFCYTVKSLAFLTFYACVYLVWDGYFKLLMMCLIWHCEMLRDSKHIF